MLEIKQIYEKEKYINLILEADPDKEIVNKYLQNSDMYGIFNRQNGKHLIRLKLLKSEL